jgi:predicted dehydrogenase
MIAYRCHYETTNLRAIRLIRQGALGRVQAIESTFGFNIAPGEWRLSKKLAGGGPLFDVGIYSLNACRYLTGEEPEHIAATASVIDQDGRFNEVEENVSWTMKFPSGIVASCNTTYGANMEGFYRVHGSKGWLEVDSAFVYEGLRLHADYVGAQLDELNRPATLRTSSPKQTTSPTASRMGRSRNRRAKKACATCATSRRFTAQRELQCRLFH